MKFLYEYRTPDNAKHNGVICASDREAAYAALKKQGIRPSRFAEAPGIINKLFGKGKRWMAICILAIIAVVSSTIAFNRSAATAQDVEALFDLTLRRQVIGDALVIEKGIKTGWADFFDLEGDRFLASYAIPGTVPAVSATTEEEVKKALASVAGPRVRSIEARQIRAMVEGMKQELREYLADGGTITKYGQRIVRRQQEEISYYNNVKMEIENAVKSGMESSALDALWERRNRMLCQLGIRPVPIVD